MPSVNHNQCFWLRLLPVRISARAASDDLDGVKASLFWSGFGGRLPSAVQVSGGEQNRLKNLANFPDRVLTGRGLLTIIRRLDALVAQLDRVSGYEPEGRGFESLPAHHFMKKACDLHRGLFLWPIFLGRHVIAAAYQPPLSLLLSHFL